MIKTKKMAQLLNLSSPRIGQSRDANQNQQFTFMSPKANQAEEVYLNFGNQAGNGNQQSFSKVDELI